MRRRPADQILHDPPLDQHCAKRAGEIGEERGKAIVEIGMDKDFLWLRGAKRQRLQRHRRVAHVVLMAGQAKGEILAKIADCGRPRPQRRDGVFHRRRKAHDEIAEMRRDGRLRRQGCEVLFAVKDQAGAAQALRAVRAGVTHAPVEAYAIAVHPSATGAGLLPDLTPCAPGLGRVAKADLGVDSDFASRGGAALEFRF